MKWLRVCSLLLPLFSSSALSAAELKGEVRFVAPITLSTNLAVTVIKTKASVGGRVKKGEQLVQLDDRVLRAQRTQYRAEVAHQKAMFTEAMHELQRSEELYDRTLLSEHDLVLARIGHVAADSSYQGANARLKQTQHAIELSRIVAPFNAIVLERHVQAGETVNGQFTSARLYTLVDAERRLVRVTVEGRQLQKLTIGAEIPVHLRGHRYGGRVEAILYTGPSPGSGETPVDIIFTLAPGDVVGIGETATVTLP